MGLTSSRPKAIFTILGYQIGTDYTCAQKWPRRFQFSKVDLIKLSFSPNISWLIMFPTLSHDINILSYTATGHRNEFRNEEIVVFCFFFTWKFHRKCILMTSAGFLDVMSEGLWCHVFLRNHGFVIGNFHITGTISHMLRVAGIFTNIYPINDPVL